MEFKNANLSFGKLYVVDPGIKKEIIIHHPAAYTATPEDIHRWHLERGWSGAGYHVYIRKNGDVYILRPLNTSGAHCKGHNKIGIGVCFEGNYSDWKPGLKVDHEMNEVQFKAGAETLVYLSKEFNISVDKMYPHNKFDNKDCPGTYFPLKRLLEETKKKLEMVDIKLNEALDIFVENGIINTPTYWQENAKEGKIIKGEYGAILIKNAAIVLKG